MEMAVANPVAESAAIEGRVPDDGGIRVLDHELIADDVAIPKHLVGTTADRGRRSNTAQQQRTNEISHDAISAIVERIERIVPSGTAGRRA
jgi:hypothetical protein